MPECGVVFLIHGNALHYFTAKEMRGASISKQLQEGEKFLNGSLSQLKGTKSLLTDSAPGKLYRSAHLTH